MRPLAPLVALLVLAGCLGADPAPPAAPAREATDAASVEAVWTNATGKLTGVPVQPGVHDVTVEVPKGALEVAATVAWTSALADLRLELLDPEGEVVERGFPETETRRSAATVEPPASGTWTVRVTARRALDEPFDVAARVALLVPEANVLADEFEIGGAKLFQEINVVMEKDATFAWSFQASGPVHYDIHSHEDGKTTYHERGVAAEGEGVFAAPKRQIYSLLFAPPDLAEGDPNPAPTTVAYRMEGKFRVHSHSQ